MKEDNSHEDDMRNHWSSWARINDVPPTLWYEECFFITKPTYRDFLVTVPLEGLDGKSG